MPPEIIRREKYLGTPADMWSIGVLMYVLLCGRHPFRAMCAKDLEERIMRGVYTFPDNIPLSGRELITKMLQLNPLARITSEEALKDKYFTEPTIEDFIAEQIGRAHV